MAKRILRAGIGVIFFFVFLIFLLAGAVKFRALSASFWKTALDKGGVYEQLQGQVEGLLSQSRESVRKQGGTAGMPKEMMMLLYIDKELTADRFRELIETNLDRLFGYVEGRERNLLLYLPVVEWNLPVQALGQPALSKLTAQTSVEEAVAAFGLKQEQAKPILEGLEQVKTLLGYLLPVWVALLLLTAGLLAGHYFLGVGLVDRVGGTAWLLMISGFVAKIIGVGAGGIFELIASSSKPPMEPLMAEIGRSLVGQFFDLGATIGLVVGIAGLVGIVGTGYLSKRGKVKEDPPKAAQSGGQGRMSLKKRVLAFGLGVTLGLVVLAGIVVGLVVAFGGKVNFKVGGGSAGTSLQATKEEVQSLAGDVYKSEKGWQIQFPAGWEVIKDEKSEGVMKKPQGTVTNWVTIEIGAVDRTKEIDSGEYIKAMKQGLPSASSFKKAVFFEEPYEEISDDTGWRRFVFTVDYDRVIAKEEMRLRLLMVQYFPAGSGDGFTINATVPVKSWDKYEKIIKESLDTFRVDK